jgi:hypothetical protein
MNSLEATAAVIDALEQAGIPYLLVGAFSSNAYGIVRSTKDADFVVSLQSGDLRRLVDRLGPNFRLDPQMKFEVLTGSVRYVITFLPTDFDIDLFRLSNDSHHAERFRRKRRVQLGELNREVWLPTAEDVIIQKLRWQRRKDLDDVVNILAVRAGKLDWEYLSNWTNLHGTYDLLDQLRRSIPGIDLGEHDCPSC